MKKINILSLCPMIMVIVGLGALAWILYAHTAANYRYINYLNNYYSDRLIERDNIITGLQSEKSNLENRLGEEKAAKAAALESLKVLDGQFKAATIESMRIESSLAERLSKAAVEAEVLKTNLGEEAAAKKAALDKIASLEAENNRLGVDTEKLQKELAASKVNLENANSDMEIFIKELGRYWSKGPLVSLKDYEYLSDSLQKTEALIGRIESVFLQGAKLNTGKALKSVIFLPADIKTPADIDQDLLTIKKSLEITQAWYQSQLGMTFSLEPPPIVVRGKNTLKWYDDLVPLAKISAIRGEIGDPKAVIVFLYGSNDRMNWGFWGYGMKYSGALISKQVFEMLKSGSSLERYIGIAVLAHEIGHVWWLPDVVTTNSGLIMGTDREGLLVAGNIFPLAIFTEQEKNILRTNLAK